MKVTPGPIEFPDDVGPGARLRRAREEADRSVSEISAALHLDSKTIQALEADSFDRLPGPTFVRGYMRSYACELGLTPEPILEAYERRGFKPPALSPGITEKPQTHASELSIRLVTYAVGAVLVLLVVLWWRSQDFQGLDIGADLLDWPLGSVSDPSPPPTETPALAVAPRNGEEGVESTPAAAGEPSEPPWDAGTAGDSGASSPSSGEGTAPGAVATMAEPPPVVAEPPPVVAEPPPAGAAGTFGTSTEGGASARPPPRPETAAGVGPGDIERTDIHPPDENTSVDSPSEPDVGSLPANPPTLIETTPPQASPSVPDDTTAPPATPGAGQSELVLDFTHESWVEIYDHEGARLFFGLVPPARALNIVGTPPFDILLGYARDVRVALDGAPFDHTPHIRHGVARFSLGTPPARAAAAMPGGADSPEIPSP